MNTAEAAYSEEYINLIISYDISEEIDITDNNDIFACPTLAGGYGVIYIRKSEVENFIRTNPLSTEVPYVLTPMGEIDLRSAGIYRILESPYIDLTGRGVIFGIIDTGIDYTSQSFIYEDGRSKILDIWDQTSGDGGEFTCYGTEYTNEMINEALNSEDPFSVVAQRDEYGHGTLLAQIAAGRRVGSFVGAAEDSEIICVKVKQVKKYMRELIRDDVFCCDSSDIMNGVDFIFRKVQMYRRPVVLLIGMGTNDGSHSGQSYFESYLSLFAGRTGAALCVPVGNEADKSHHAFSELSNEYTDFEIETNGNKKGFELNIWSDSANRFFVSVNLPTGERLEKIYLVTGFDQSYYFPLSGTTVSVSAEYPIGSSMSQRIQLRFRNVTDGIWSVRIYPEKVIVRVMNAWLPAEGLAEGNVRFLAPDPFSTATVPSTAMVNMAVGGYSSADESIYSGSGRGPTAIYALVPIFTAPAVGVTAPAGSITGTSAGAAIAAGAALLLMQWGFVDRNNVNLNTVVINSYLVGGAVPVNTGEYPDYIWGFGKINLYNSFSEIII